MMTFIVTISEEFNTVWKVYPLVIETTQTKIKYSPAAHGASHWPWGGFTD